MTNYVEFVKSVESTSWHQPNERLLHAAMGLCTEVGELLEVEDDQHMFEELGDVFWYLALAHDALGLDFYAEDIEISQEEIFDSIRGESLLETCTIYSTEMLDMVKKQIFYGREIDLKKAEKTLFILKAALELGAEEVGLDADEIIAGNMRKLMKRFPEKFSEDAAINRDVKAEYAAMNG